MSRGGGSSIYRRGTMTSTVIQSEVKQKLFVWELRVSPEMFDIKLNGSTRAFGGLEMDQMGPNQS